MKVALLISYYVLLNIYGFYLMGADKNKAKKGKWRIKESTLWLVGFIGGAIGLTVGMNAFRHKTKHKTFVAGFPILMMVHIVLFSYFLYKMS
ncbi:DUF1294 domain-containing protein [Bacillus sp. UMB0893]|uniref:DUF1294 domain-containing protein n=1 Tax=Bacillus sp. UMB0893 TaxID=2066053 RepID=UPI000C763588|nr:DUF1294 domain-containing protein [Bacillus sp. UMB0893]PLR68365.1 DUF1294 domain-containing protein [Bacillus sp. UMB0893]QNG60989.1 DUF1294 domain-containing protein [Bacillus sp. PAMC26568]